MKKLLMTMGQKLMMTMGKNDIEVHGLVDDKHRHTSDKHGPDSVDYGTTSVYHGVVGVEPRSAGFYYEATGVDHGDACFDYRAIGVDHGAADVEPRSTDVDHGPTRVNKEGDNELTREAAERDKAFNSTIIQARNKQVIIIMKMIINYLMVMLVRKRSEVEKSQHEKEPKVFRFVEKVKKKSCLYYPVYNGNYKYQVTSRGEDQFVVDIDKKTYACKKWQLIGIPCIHGMAALLSSNRDPIDFIDNKYKKTIFLKASMGQTCG
ncbi:hypothetical protein Ddye_024828 [Dipteronia dyeriana]|uniref:SWIM-type domain-containing protein n=1 Tax=Dipteronia dyeriana TaxID=168575 RepID=A0AAD9WUU4_9ROSI|nr:hypothetical protein Ddye_024828 [Dipteronia dyeriana]